MVEPTLKRRARWYVYELIDPRDGLAFYVGKGCGNRIAAHERAAEAGQECSEKISRIKEIWADGLQVEQAYVAWFWDENAAYEYEAVRVAEYGLDALTNIIPGGGGIRGSFIRRAKPKQVAPWTPMEAARTLCKRDNGVALFAAWLAAEQKGARLELISTLGARWTDTVAECAIRLFPRIWGQIRQSVEAVDFIAPHLRRHGVELVYGRT